MYNIQFTFTLTDHINLPNDTDSDYDEFEDDRMINTQTNDVCTNDIDRIIDDDDDDPEIDDDADNAEIEYNDDYNDAIHDIDNQYDDYDDYDDNKTEYFSIFNDHNYNVNNNHNQRSPNFSLHSNPKYCTYPLSLSPKSSEHGNDRDTPIDEFAWSDPNEATAPKQLANPMIPKGGSVEKHAIKQVLEFRFESERLDVKNRSVSG